MKEGERGLDAVAFGKFLECVDYEVAAGVRESRRSGRHPPVSKLRFQEKAVARRRRRVGTRTAAEAAARRGSRGTRATRGRGASAA